MSTASKFYSIFWQSSQCRNIFLLHKEQLLEKKEYDLGFSKKSHYLQRFVLSNSLTRKESSNKIQNRIQNRNIDSDHNLVEILKKNFDEKKINDFIDKKFGYAIEKVSAKLNKGKLAQMRFYAELIKAFSSEVQFLEFLKRYKIIDDLFSSIDECINYYIDFFEKEVHSIVSSEHFSDMFKSIDELSNTWSNFTFSDLISSNKFYTDILYHKENYKDRIQLFDSLFDSEVLVGGYYKTYYECVHCVVNTFSGSVTLNVTPSKVKLKCPNCNKEVFYLAPYRLNDQIFNDIKSKDGILFSAIEHLLKNKNINYKKNVTSGKDVELDFLVYNKDNSILRSIIEVKMFKTDRPPDTTLSNLNEGMRKFLTARDKLVKSNNFYHHVEFVYVTNIEDDSLIKSLKINFKNELMNSNVRVNTVSDFIDFADHVSLQYK